MILIWPELENTRSYIIPEQAEIASGYTPKPGWVTQTSQFAVAAANPHATGGGYKVLKSGVSAIYEVGVRLPIELIAIIEMSVFVGIVLA